MTQEKSPHAHLIILHFRFYVKKKSPKTYILCFSCFGYVCNAVLGVSTGRFVTE